MLVEYLIEKRLRAGYSNDSIYIEVMEGKTMKSLFIILLLPHVHIKRPRNEPRYTLCSVVQSKVEKLAIVNNSLR